MLLKFAMQKLSVTEKFKHWKIGTPLAGEVENLADLVARWHASMKYCHVFGAFARLLACWHVKLKSCTL